IATFAIASVTAGQVFRHAYASRYLASASSSFRPAVAFRPLKKAASLYRGSATTTASVAEGALVEQIARRNIKTGSSASAPIGVFSSSALRIVRVAPEPHA